MSNDHSLSIRGKAYTYTVEPEEGFLLGSNRTWQGYRVRYRAAGARRWSHVLMIDHDHAPTEAELSAAIEFHVYGQLAKVSDAGEL